MDWLWSPVPCGSEDQKERRWGAVYSNVCLQSEPPPPYYTSLNTSPVPPNTLLLSKIHLHLFLSFHTSTSTTPMYFNYSSINIFIPQTPHHTSTYILHLVLHPSLHTSTSTAHHLLYTSSPCYSSTSSPYLQLLFLIQFLHTGPPGRTPYSLLPPLALSLTAHSFLLITRKAAVTGGCLW